MSSQEKTPDDLDAELASVHKANEERLRKLDSSMSDMRAETSRLLQEVDSLLGRTDNPPGKDPERDEKRGRAGLVAVPALDLSLPDWDSAVRQAQDFLSKQSIEAPSSCCDLLSPEENSQIVQYLDRPLYERLAWDRWDYIVGFGAGIAGAAIDVLLGTPGRFVQGALGDKDDWLGSWAETLHAKHPVGAPVDYQGPHFGGPHHRGLSPGHDLLRPLEGIRQFKEGVFSGFYFKDGVKHAVEIAVNQNGTPYAPMSWGAAVLAWLVHNACDFFSPASLPIPGTSWLYGSADREVRLFVQKELYQHGVNLRHVTLQSLAPVAVEVGVGTYWALRHRGSKEDPLALQQKRTELLLLGHALTVAVNAGKVALLKDPTMLNIPALLAFLARLLRLVLLELGRTSYVAKIRRNASELMIVQEGLERSVLSRLTAPCLLD